MAKHLFSAYGYAALAALHQADGKKFCAARNEQGASTSAANMATANFAKIQEEAPRQEEFNLIATRFYRNGLILADAQPAPVPTTNEQVRIGHMVTLRLGESGTRRYLVGGENEPDSIPDVCTISIAAPLGHAMLGSSVGDTVTASVGRRKVEAEILNIEIPEHALAQQAIAA